MEDQCSPLSWACYYQEEGLLDLKHSLLYTTLELETTVLSAREELARKDDELVHLRSLLSKAVQERDEAQAQCQRLMLEKLELYQQLQQQQQQFKKQNSDAAPSSGTITISNEEEFRGQQEYSNAGTFSSSDCDENLVASPGKDSMLKQQQQQPPLTQPPQAPSDVIDGLLVSCRNPLPEKGKFLQAVMEAGPLLQTLLLAGPLPQWQHPPPQLNSIDIPPVTIASPTPRLLHHQDSCLSTSSCFSTKRVLVNSTTTEDSDFSPSNSKYQKVVHQSSLTNILCSP